MAKGNGKWQRAWPLGDRPQAMEHGVVDERSGYHAASGSCCRAACARRRSTSATGASSAFVATAIGPQACRDRRRRSRGAARARRHARAHQRARPDRLGRIRDTRTRAAAAGGVTTLVDMPLNSIPATTTVDGARGASAPPQRSMPRRRRVLGRRGSGQRRATRAARARRRARLQVLPVAVGRRRVRSTSPKRTCARRCRSSRSWACRCSCTRSCRRCCASRHGRRIRARIRDVAREPPAGKRARGDRSAAAPRARVRSARPHRAPRVAGRARTRSRAARPRASPLTVETCPHYLTFAAEEIADGATAFKCAPPIRERAESRGLWSALGERRDRPRRHRSFAGAAGAEASRRRRSSCARGAASRRCSSGCPRSGPAPPRAACRSNALRDGSAGAGSARRSGAFEGAIAAGRDADLVIFDPDAELVVDPSTLYHRHPVTPYAGMSLRGRVLTTILRGQIVFDESGSTGQPSGCLIAGTGKRIAESGPRTAS